jgi:Resolvase, N terminal domain
MTAVLIYTRLSTEDVHDATVHQEVACRSYAQARNWDVAATLGDLDASAYQPRARRPGFEILIAEAAARSADGVLVELTDRGNSLTFDIRCHDPADRLPRGSRNRPPGFDAPVCAPWRTRQQRRLDHGSIGAAEQACRSG